MLTIASDEDTADLLRLVHRLEPERLAAAPDGFEPEVANGLGEALWDAVASPPSAEPPPGPAPLLALNDYAVAGRMTGGAIRIRETLSRLGRDVVLLDYGDEPGLRLLAPSLAEITLPRPPAWAALAAALRRAAGVRGRRCRGRAPLPG